MDCGQVGWAVQRSGAGRIVPGEQVSAHAGVETHKKIGDSVAVGETLFTIFVEQEERLEPVAAILSRCFTLSAKPPLLAPLIYRTIA
jgi:thymidine phosphorylase